MARVHRQLGAEHRDVADLVDAREVELGIDAWVKRFSASVIRSTLPVRSPLPKERPLDALATGHQRKFRRGHGGAAVVVRMQADDHAVAARDLPAEGLDQVGIEVGRRELDRWQAG